ncbi:hypothetical protein H6F42_02400 [Pseudanabaena sp. FACHB-1998]|nr:hypothetical protein [Pseudanabaena sp. FACHB-1998]MBD2175770.1 hypothetical protein [Pseudanabaena sp. FACHB-1998]
MNPKFIVIDTNALISAVLSPNGIAYLQFVITIAASLTILLIGHLMP